MNKYKEVDINRVFSVFLIILLHSFAFYTGAWAPPKPFVQIELYKWIGELCGSVAVPSFVFISGFLFWSQMESNKWTLSNLIKKKAQRLLLPSIIFGSLYTLLFKGHGVSDLFNILNGVGHLWFLPMLFWCFICSFFLFRLPAKYSLAIAFVLFFLGGGYLPFGISRMFYNLPYFLLGGICHSHKDLIGKCKNKFSLSLSLFIGLFVLMTLLHDTLYMSNLSGIMKLIIDRGDHFIRMIYGSLGVILLFLFSRYLSIYKLPRIFPTLVRYSFGIYLYHQFILILLFRNLNLYEVVGSFLPIIGFVAAFVCSYVLSYLTIKTKVGKQLI
jgi:peptidoglycan/LPS O-acetylase OafA/YrhL